MSIDPASSAQAVTPLDAAAMTASERIIVSSEDTRANQIISDAHTEGATKALSAAAEVSTGMIYDSDRPGGLPSTTISSVDASMGLTATAATVGTGGVIDHTHEFFAATQLDQAYSASLATAVHADPDYSGRIVNYTA